MLSKPFLKFLVIFGFFLLSYNFASAVVSITVTVKATPPSIKKGESSLIEWSATNATRCTLFDADDIAIPGYLNTGTTGSYTTPKLDLTTTYNIICDDYVYTPPPMTCPYYYPVCFIADTIVSMADGTTKKIQDVKIGDILKGEKTNNTVLGFHDPKLEGRKLYSFNGGRYFVTAEHPFKTTDGWKSIDPSKTAEENIGIKVTPLHIGDVLLTENGKVLLKTIDSKNDKSDTQLYNFMLNGDHTYYADGYLVHNKEMCTGPSGEILCGTNNFCIDGSGQTSSTGYCPMGCDPLYYRTGSTGCTSGISVCDGSAIKCITNSVACGAPQCTGMVAGSSPTDYEGQSCSQFTTSADCLRGWLTHGCSWNGAVALTGECDSYSDPSFCSQFLTSNSCNLRSQCYWFNYAAQ